MKRFVPLLALALAACSGPISNRVKPSLVKALPVEARIDLLDAENALFASIDGLDEAKDSLAEAEADVDSADDRIDEAKQQRKKAQDQRASDIAEMAVTEAKARKDYLKIEVKVLRSEVKLREAELDVARARYELAKAQAVKRVNLEGAQKVKVEDFEAQVQKLEERAKNVGADLDQARADAQERKKSWDDSRAELAKATGGAQGSAWVE